MEHDIPSFARRWIDLAQPRLGAAVLSASDEFFASRERLISPAEPVFVPGKYDEHGKWMDGWETRRRRNAGHDHCIVQLGLRGIIHGVNVDTRHFTGNFPPLASIDAYSGDGTPNDRSAWTRILQQQPLHGDSHNWFEIADSNAWTHLRLNIYPDGGVARLRVYGQAAFDWSAYHATEPVDLVAAAHGGRALECNDEHFGSMHNLLMPGRGRDMGDGWETRRRRTPGHDWVIIRLGHPGVVQRVEVDTAHFKGNYPDRVSIQAARLTGDADEHVAPRSLFWQTLLTEQPLHMDSQHSFERELAALGAITHVRVNIHPDGGLSRVRMFGYPQRQG